MRLASVIDRFEKSTQARPKARTASVACSSAQEWAQAAWSGARHVTARLAYGILALLGLWARADAIAVTGRILLAECWYGDHAECECGEDSAHECVTSCEPPPDGPFPFF